MRARGALWKVGALTHAQSISAADVAVIGEHEGRRYVLSADAVQMRQSRCGRTLDPFIRGMGHDFWWLPTTAVPLSSIALCTRHNSSYGAVRCFAPDKDAALRTATRKQLASKGHPRREATHRPHARPGEPAVDPATLSNANGSGIYLHYLAVFFDSYE